MLTLLIIISIFGLFKVQKHRREKKNSSEISIYLSWPDASAVEVEEMLILPLEKRFKELDAAILVKSAAYYGGARFDLIFSSWYSLNKLMKQARSIVEEMPASPKNIEKPVIYAGPGV
jgi:multidrug efflux pump subunit AcrB